MTENLTQDPSQVVTSIAKAEKENSKNVVQKVSEFYLSAITDTLEDSKVVLSASDKENVICAIGMIDAMMRETDKSVTQVEQKSLYLALREVVVHKYNVIARPAQVYFKIVRVKVKDKKDSNGRQVYEERVAIDVQADGIDHRVRTFGDNIKRLHQCWMVREGDEFTMPQFDGLLTTSPKWTPKGVGRYVKVVYPIEYVDGSVRFQIAHREDVAVNLRSHIQNNLMNETFGLAESYWDASSEKKKEIDKRKDDIVRIIQSKTLDALLVDDALRPYMSPAWRNNPERMIVRKMRKNALIDVPIDYSKIYAANGFALPTDDEDLMDDNENPIVKERKESAITIEVGANANKLPLPTLPSEETTQNVETVASQPTPSVTIPQNTKDETPKGETAKRPTRKLD